MARPSAFMTSGPQIFRQRIAATREFYRAWAIIMRATKPTH